MGGFGSGDWSDFVTQKDNTSLCRTISAKQLKDLGLLSGSECYEISWRNCFGESLGKVHIELLEGGSYISVFKNDARKTTLAYMVFFLIFSSII